MVTDEYEKALLGVVLAGFQDVPSLARVVSEPDFARPEHGKIWQAILAVHARGHAPSPTMVMDQMGSVAHKELPRGPIYLSDLASDITFIPVQAPFYAEKIRQASLKRRIAGMGVRLRQIEEDPDLSAEDILARLRTDLDSFEQQAADDNDIVSTSDALQQVFDVIDHGEPNAMPSPWPDLNELISGWYPGQLIVVAALTGVGKSIFLENAATDVARNHGKHVLFCSLEMKAKEITQRTMAHTAKVPLSKIRAGGWSESDPDHHAMATAAQIVMNTPLKVVHDFSQSVADIRARAWVAKQKAIREDSELGMVVVDYCQLVRARDPKVPRHEQVGEICRSLKALAGELDVPVMTAAQLSRAGASRSNPVPILSDLRESGDIEHTADVVIFMHEQQVEDQGKLMPTGDVDLIVAKQRAGTRGFRTVQKVGYYSKLANRHQLRAVSA